MKRILLQFAIVTFCLLFWTEPKYISALAPEAVEAPKFEVDPFWPKPLPNNWRLGSAAGVSVDAEGHIWVINRPESLNAKETYAATNPPNALCCSPAPPVLEFDHEGNLIGQWGGPGEGYDWPQQNHGLTVDYKDNVWIAASGREDSQILKFTKDGKLLLQIGLPRMNKGSNDTENLKGAAKIIVDATADEAYVADGYGNKRVIVFDAETGKYKRHWGAYGNKPDDTPAGKYNPAEAVDLQFRNAVHCVMLSRDNLLYVCDRSNDRIQVFRRDGTFVKEAFVERATVGEGSVWDIAFSSDPQQKFLYVADGSNEKIHILLRETLQVLTSFGAGGRQPGQFYAVHSLATDSQGNIYTAETYEGKRLQKFVYKGVERVTELDQGTPWPAAARTK